VPFALQIFCTNEAKNTRRITKKVMSALNMKNFSTFFLEQEFQHIYCRRYYEVSRWAMGHGPWANGKRWAMSST
jgi:hypothetical protein